MAVAQRVSVDEALKRAVSHADVVGAGIMTSRGALVERRGAFSDADARTSCRLVAVASHAIISGSGGGIDDNDDGIEMVRARRGACELVVARCGGVVIAARASST
jgi:hypothetical protein